MQQLFLKQRISGVLSVGDKQGDRSGGVGKDTEHARRLHDCNRR